MNRTSEISIEREEWELLLRQLAEMTEKGYIRWQCTGYHPIDLLPDMEQGKRETAYLIQVIEAQAEYGGHFYNAEISETITIPAGKGYIGLSLDVSGGEDGERYASYLNIDPNKILSKRGMARAANAIVTQIKDSEAVQDGFAEARFLTEFSPDYITQNPLAKLGKALCDNRQLAEYHRAVYDRNFRNQLLAAIF